MGICPPGPPDITSAADQVSSSDIFNGTANYTETRQVSLTVLENQKVLINGFAAGGGNNIGEGLESGRIFLRLIRGTTTLATSGESFLENDVETETVWFGAASISWMDSPPPGTHVYKLEIEIELNPDDLTTLIINSRGINAIVF